MIAATLRPAVIAVFCAIASVAVVAQVWAHARYSESTPGRGEVLAAPPPAVSIKFTQDVQKITGTYGIEVTHETGVEVTAADAVLSDSDRAIMSVVLEPNLPAGRYVVRFKNVSDEDGDPYEGAFSFYVGREPTPQEVAEDRTFEERQETPDVPVRETPGASPTATSENGNSDDDSDNTGVIVAAVIVGVIAVAAVAGILAWRAAR